MEAQFHNGEPVTAEDVKFSFERYRGAAHAQMKERVAGVDVLDPQHVRFRLKDPWPDFLTFYSEASGAGWIVPKKYVEKVGEDGSRRRRSAPAMGSSGSRPVSNRCWKRRAAGGNSTVAGSFAGPDGAAAGASW